MVVKEAMRTFTLNLTPADAVVVSRVLPAAAGDGYFAAPARRPTPSTWSSRRSGFEPLPILEAPFFEREVTGAAMLDRLAAQLFGERDLMSSSISSFSSS